jgi:hypothetical protein
MVEHQTNRVKSSVLKICKAGNPKCKQSLVCLSARLFRSEIDDSGQNLERFRVTNQANLIWTDPKAGDETDGGYSINSVTFPRIDFPTTDSHQYLTPFTLNNCDT